MSVDQTIIRPATTEEEKREIWRLYYDIYIKEHGYTPNADHENQILLDDLDSTASHYAVKDCSGALIGTYRVNRFCDLSDPIKQLSPLPVTELLERAPAEALTYTSRVMVRKEWRGSTLLAKMAIHFASDLIDLGIRFDSCLSLPHLVAFYEQLGYQRYGQRVMQAGAGLEFPMTMSIQNKQHFLRVRSPLSRSRKVQACEDNWEDGQWLKELAKPWGYNHRLMKTKEFWDATGMALLFPEGNRGLFSGLSIEEARRVLKPSPILEVKAGDQIVYSGLHQENLFVVIQGEFRLQRTQGDCSTPPRLLQSGTHFGSREFINPGLSHEDITATTDGKILLLDQVFLRKARTNHPRETEVLLSNIERSACV